MDDKKEEQNTLEGKLKHPFSWTWSNMDWWQWAIILGGLVLVLSK